MKSIHLIKKYFIYSIVIVYFSSCENTTTNNQWSEIVLEPEISKNSVYHYLDTQKEFPTIFNRFKPLTKRTSDVEYIIKAKEYQTDKNLSKYNICRAYFHKSDTLIIRIGNDSGLGGYGFQINYVSKKFHTKAYSYNDLPDIKAPIATNNLRGQKLILNKAIYKVGDSIYGNIEFKSTEINKKGEEIEYFGKGYFRAIITKL